MVAICGQGATSVLMIAVIAHAHGVERQISVWTRSNRALFTSRASGWRLLFRLATSSLFKLGRGTTGRSLTVGRTDLIKLVRQCLKTFDDTLGVFLIEGVLDAEAAEDLFEGFSRGWLLAGSSCWQTVYKILEMTRLCHV